MSKFYRDNDDHFNDDHFKDYDTDNDMKKEVKSEIRNVELAQAYVPFQKMNRLFSPEEGLRKGTIFPELYKPYRPHKKQ
ncbi:MAG: spore coat associated protein CotJA [Oscillospiraceae bacterium]|nr:spore coat associated protein CotJA [Oscillospiraceae bacterium]